MVGNKAAVADHMSGVDFVDTSNADKPAMLGSFYVEGYAREVAAFGSMAYAVDAPTGVYTFDMTQPGRARAGARAADGDRARDDRRVGSQGRYAKAGGARRRRDPSRSTT